MASVRPSKLRGYQARIVSEVVDKGSSLVMLPTGSGKTLVAAEIIKRIGAKALMLVPTCPLVDQQARAVQEWMGVPVDRLKGGMRVPLDFCVLVSTPKAFEAAQSKHPEKLGWPAIGVVVFDEVHHLLKKHPYRTLALAMLSLPDADAPTVVGISASLTYEVAAPRMCTVVQHLVQELRIKHLACATPEELAAAGFADTGGRARVCAVRARSPSPGPADDVHDIAVGVDGDALRPAKPEDVLVQLQGGVGPAPAQALWHVLLRMEGLVREHDAAFVSPLPELKPREWALYAKDRARNVTLRADVRDAYASLTLWYEALRVLLGSGGAAGGWGCAAARLLLGRFGQDPDGDAVHTQWERLGGVREAVCAFWEAPVDATRLESFKRVLLGERERRGDAFRGIVFVEQQIMTLVLHEYIAKDAELSGAFRATFVYASNAGKQRAAAVTTLSRAVAEERLRGFADGEFDLLLATSVAEEGLDVPEVNCVVRFDCVPNTVSLVQGRGRARKRGSSFVVLDDRGGSRSVRRMEAAEARQTELVRTLDAAAVCSTEATQRRLREAQLDREEAAVGMLGREQVASGGAWAALSAFARRTFGQLNEDCGVGSDGSWFCCVEYTSLIRRVRGTAWHAMRDGAREAAAVNLIAALDMVSEQTEETCEAEECC